MKSLTSINGKNKRELIVSSIIFVFSLAGLVVHLYTKKWWSVLFTIIGFLISYIVYLYLKDKEEETKKKELAEWDKFFYDLSTLPSFEKENLLKREMPLSFRLLLERSLSVEVTLQEYQEITKDLPFSYQCVMESLYFYQTYQSNEEWLFAYEQFLNEKEENEKQKEKKKLVFYRSFPLLISFLFAGILFAFTFIA